MSFTGGGRSISEIMSLNNYITSRLIHYLGFEPTDCQRDLFSTLSDFINKQSNECDILVISGYAGTGKTSSVCSIVKLLDEIEMSSVLLAPTGRAAKVLSNYTGKRAYTIHKQIYRQKSIKDGMSTFVLDMNKNHDTVFVVDEASLISVYSNEAGIFGSGRLLEDLILYIRSNLRNKLIIIGDPAQLPPVGESISRAMDRQYLSSFGEVMEAQLKTVVRQAKESGILVNATSVRRLIEEGKDHYPQFITDGFDDVVKIGGGDLIEEILSCYDKYGVDECVVLCRSNKRANRYNAGIRSKILYRDERIGRGDKIMVVKNCYQFIEDSPEIGFIANGDVAELVKIGSYEQRYGLDFAKATLKFTDYNDLEINAKVILNTLESESASLSSEQSKLLFSGVLEDYSHIKQKRKRLSAVKEDLYFNALQIKYANAITCHKSQGGQWRVVFIDNPFWKDQIVAEDLKWLYTAVTRAVDKVYFVNFDQRFFVK